MVDAQTIHIVDDDSGVRHSLAFLFESHGFSVKTYESADHFLEAASAELRGCLITDVRMPGLGGLELIQRLREQNILIPAIVITGHGDIPLAVEAMKHGAADFIEKPFEDTQILGAARSAMQGHAAQDERLAERTAILERIASLTKREREVLDGIVAGHANKIVAFDLGISQRTVEVYRANVMTKMQAGSLSDLVRMTLLAQSSEKP
ncbi:MAG: response regulator [Alphaproteobacteria bacterium]|nr:response regulator [Alphaproteobacteria bacterium]